MADLQMIYDADPNCPLRDVPGHRCANRDGVQREADGRPPLRPGSTCYEGAYYSMTVDLLAEKLDRLS